MDDISLNDINENELYDVSIKCPKYTLYLEWIYNKGKLRYSLFDHSKRDYILTTYSREKIRIYLS